MRGGRFGQGDLAEGLRVGVGVGEAQRGGPGAAGLRHAVLHPAGAELFGLGGQGGGAGGAEFLVGGLSEFRQLLGGAAGVLGLCSDASGAVDLGTPVDVDEEGALVDGLLRCGAPAASGHVAGRDGDEVGDDAEALEGLDDADGAEQVDLDGLVEWRVEADDRRRVDEEVAGGEGGAALFVEAEAVVGDVAGDCGDSPGGHLLEGVLAEFGAEAVEGVVVEDVTADAPFGASTPGPDDEDELAVRDGAEESFDEGGAEEASASGDGDAASGQRFGDHGPLSTRWSGYLPDGQDK